MNDFEKEVMARLMGMGHLDIMTDNNGQIVIYTSLAETHEGELVEFDLDTGEAGGYRKSE